MWVNASSASFTVTVPKMSEAEAPIPAASPRVILHGWRIIVKSVIKKIINTITNVLHFYHSKYVYSQILEIHSLNTINRRHL